MHKMPNYPLIDMTQCPIEEEVSIYYPDGKLIVRTNNELEFNYVRLQIAINSIEGCYLYFKNEKFEILPYGTIEHWPLGLFDKNENMASEFFKNGMFKHEYEKYKNGRLKQHNTVQKVSN